MLKQRLEHYIKRFHALPRQIQEEADENLIGIIVIPCFMEEDWKTTLNSLLHCHPSHARFEVLLVVNASINASNEIMTHQRETFDEAVSFARQHRHPHLRIHILDAMNLPPKHAGVGLARKIGMDEALYRLDQAGNLENGFIVGLDADSICKSNYLTALETHFEDNPKTPGCSLHFEHPLSGDLPSDIYETAGLYELHLRYYVQALRFIGFPHAFHTIGSSMAARAPVYMAQGGMNRRKAGEDFYFLHKIIPLGYFTELTETTISPSPRPSDRVPFGTGRAVSKYRGQDSFPTYPWEAMLEIKSFFRLVRQYDPFRSTNPESPPRDEVSPPIRAFLESSNGWDRWQACITSTAGFEAYQRRFFQWFDGFLCMKCIHFLRDTFYGEMDVVTATQQLIQASDIVTGFGNTQDPVALLKVLRKHQRNPWCPM